MVAVESSDPAAIERAVSAATGVAVTVAVVLTCASSLVQRWIRRRTAMHLLATAVAIVLSIASFVCAATAFHAFLMWRLRAPDSGLMGLTFVHPGALHKLAPLVAIAFTWIALAVASRRRAR